MKIGALGETFEGENRVAMTPDSALQLQKLGHVCVIQSGAGLKAGFPLPYECASGTCGACRASLVSGEVRELWARAPGG